MKRDAERDGLSSAEPVKLGKEVSSPSKGEITRWLAACEGGDPGALKKLLPLVYDELHRLAMRAFSREPAGHTLQPIPSEKFGRRCKKMRCACRNSPFWFCLP